MTFQLPTVRRAARALALATACAVSTAYAASEGFDYHGHAEAAAPAPIRSLDAPAALQAGAFDQKIDHAEPLAGATFKQRYWIDSQYAGALPETAPVIYHICGEGDAQTAYFTSDNAIAWARSLGAHLVYLEHRYYGKSQPRGDLAASHLRYLTLDNVLEDLADFQAWLTARKGWRGKWLSVGGSYAGTLSALYRLRHPEKVVGALASSAPMSSGPNEAEGTASDLRRVSSNDPGVRDGERAWAYQACTTFGFWETNGYAIQDPSAWLCGEAFGDVPRADSAAYNRDYYLPFITPGPDAPSRILFTYGSEDIWTDIGIPARDNANPGIRIQMIQGAGHHYDLNAPLPSDSAAVVQARAEFAHLAQAWLAP